MLIKFFAVMITAIVSNYYLSLVVVVLCALFLSIRWYYLRVAREMKRLEALGKSVCKAYCLLQYLNGYNFV